MSKDPKLRKIQIEELIEAHKMVAITTNENND